MYTLRIITRFPGAVVDLLKTHELVEQVPPMPEPGAVKLEMAYPDDAISQALAFWFAMAEGCGLINQYKLLTPGMLKEEAERKRAVREMREQIAAYERQHGRNRNRE